MESNSTTSFEGEEVGLVCKATNYFDTEILQAQIVWYDPSGKPVSPDENTTYSGSGISQYENVTYDILDGQVESTLWFDMVHHNDSGEYTCRAFNLPQLYVEAVIKLTVECKTTTLSTFAHIATVGIKRECNVITLQKLQ